MDPRKPAKKLLYDALQQSVLNGSLTALEEEITLVDVSDEERKPAIDQTFREVLKQFIEQQDTTGPCATLVNLSVQASEKGVSSPTLPFLLLSDTFDMITLDDCEKLFCVVEDGLASWQSPHFYGSGKNHLLRMCNDMQRRMSKSKNTGFCGRIQVFLSRLFPPAEKSGVNLMGNFNTENLTVFSETSQLAAEHEAKMEVKREESMEVEDGEMQESADKQAPLKVDHTLYEKFWSLQDFFRKPVQLYADKEAWKTFTERVDEVQAAFASSKLEDVTSSNRKPAVSTSDHDFFPKYLTNEKLLDLQLGDANFRRYFMLQFLIITQYLEENTRFKVATQVLEEDQKAWLKVATEKTYALMRETPPEGQLFADTVQHILSRESQWNQWKNESCPNYVLERSEKSAGPPAKRARLTLGEEMRQNKGKILMPTAELTRLWNHHPDNVEACRVEDRKFSPSMENYFSEAIEQLDPAAMVEPKYRLINQPLYAWRSLRLMARRSPHFFSVSSVLGQPLTAYLKNNLTRIAKDFNLLPQEAEGDGLEDAEEDNEIPDNSSPHNEAEDVKREDDGDTILSEARMRAAGKALGPAWVALAKALKFADDEIEYLQGETKDVGEQAHSMLTLWGEMDQANNMTVGGITGMLKGKGYETVTVAMMKAS